MNRRLAPWVAALRIARRQALRAKGRTALSAIMVGLPVLLIAALLVLFPSMTPTEATTVRHTLGDSAQAYVRVDPGCVPLSQMPNDKGSGACGIGLDEHGELVSEGEQLTPEAAEVLLGELVPGARLATRWDLEASLPRPSGRGLDLSVRSLDTSGELASTVLVIDGEAPTAAGEVGLSVAVADRYGYAVGDALNLEIDGASTAATITALLSVSDTPVLAAPGTVPLGTATPSWYVLGDEPLTWSDVVALNRGGGFAVSRHVLENPPDPMDVPAVQIFGEFDDGSTQVAAIAGLVVALALLEVVLLVGPAFAVGARRQSRSLALVAATGGTRKDLRRIVLANGVVVGVGASALAVALGVLGAVVAAAWPYRDPYAVFPNLVVPPYVVGLVAVGTLVAVVAAWIPARQASRVDVVAALAGRRADATPRATLGIVGLVVAGVGVPLGAYGGYVGSSLLSGAGGSLVVLGLVAASGLLITAIGRLARRTGVTTRIALRDLARQRGRTAPAVAAVLGAIAAATAGAVFAAAEAQHHEASWRPETAMDVIKVRLSSWESTTPATPEDAAAVTAAIQQIDPGTEVATLRMALPADPPEEGTWWGVTAVPDDTLMCPLWLLDREPTEEERAEYANHLGCGDSQLSGSFWSSNALHPSVGQSEGVLTDDGSAFAIIAGDVVPELAENLAAGRVPTAGYSSVWQDGNVRLQVEGSGSDDGDPQTTVLPGARVEGRLTVLHHMILPLSLLDHVEVDLDVVPHAVVAQPSARWTEAQEAELATALQGISDEMAVDVERLPERDVSLTVLLFVGSAGLLALAATWIASGLAAVEARADLATLSAVGASPRVRRRVAGLQSGFLTLTGVLPGIASGLVVGWAFVTASAGLGTEYPDPAWQMAVPWTVLAAAVVVLPLLAGGATALFTPGKLPLARRAAE